jgi:Ca-activated chloride channel family protein
MPEGPPQMSPPHRSRRRAPGRRRHIVLALAIAAALAVTPALTVTTPLAFGWTGQQRFKASVDLVQFSVVVTDKQGAPITGLKIGDFEVMEEGKPQTITYFAEGDPEDGDHLGEALPLHLGLTLDLSGSMERDIHDVRTAVIKFLNNNRSAIDFTLVDFDTEIRIARYSADESERLIERIRRRRPDGWTALFDAVGVYLNSVGPLDGQKIMLLYTDGGDTRSELTFSDLIDLLKSSDVTVYAIGYLENTSSSYRNQAQNQLKRMAEITGGQAFFPSNVKELDKIYDKIQREIAARYSLGYVSSDTRKDGAWRKVTIKAKRQDLKDAKLRTRTGYFAPYQPGSY